MNLGDLEQLFACARGNYLSVMVNHHLRMTQSSISSMASVRNISHPLRPLAIQVSPHYFINDQKSALAYCCYTTRRSIFQSQLTRGNLRPSSNLSPIQSLQKIRRPGLKDLLQYTYDVNETKYMTLPPTEALSILEFLSQPHFLQLFSTYLHPTAILKNKVEKKIYSLLRSSFEHHLNKIANVCMANEKCSISALRPLLRIQVHIGLPDREEPCYFSGDSASMKYIRLIASNPAQVHSNTPLIVPLVCSIGTIISEPQTFPQSRSWLLEHHNSFGEVSGFVPELLSSLLCNAHSISSPHEITEVAFALSCIAKHYHSKALDREVLELIAKSICELCFCLVKQETKAHEKVKSIGKIIFSLFRIYDFSSNQYESLHFDCVEACLSLLLPALGDSLYALKTGDSSKHNRIDASFISNVLQSLTSIKHLPSTEELELRELITEKLILPLSNLLCLSEENSTKGNLSRDPWNALDSSFDKCSRVVLPCTLSQRLIDGLLYSKTLGSIISIVYAVQKLRGRTNENLERDQQIDKWIMNILKKISISLEEAPSTSLLAPISTAQFLASYFALQGRANKHMQSDDFYPHVAAIAQGFIKEHSNKKGDRDSLNMRGDFNAGFDFDNIHINEAPIEEEPNNRERRHSIEKVHVSLSSIFSYMEKHTFWMEEIIEDTENYLHIHSSNMPLQCLVTIHSSIMQCLEHSKGERDVNDRITQHIYKEILNRITSDTLFDSSGKRNSNTKCLVNNYLWRSLQSVAIILFPEGIRNEMCWAALWKQFAVRFWRAKSVTSCAFLLSEESYNSNRFIHRDSTKRPYSLWSNYDFFNLRKVYLSSTEALPFKAPPQNQHHTTPFHVNKEPCQESINYLNNERNPYFHQTDASAILEHLVEMKATDPTMQFFIRAMHGVSRVTQLIVPIKKKAQQNSKIYLQDDERFLSIIKYLSHSLQTERRNVSPFNCTIALANNFLYSLAKLNVALNDKIIEEYERIFLDIVDINIQHLQRRSDPFLNTANASIVKRMNFVWTFFSLHQQHVKYHPLLRSSAISSQILSMLLSQMHPILEDTKASNIKNQVLALYYLGCFLEDFRKGVQDNTPSRVISNQQDCTATDYYFETELERIISALCGKFKGQASFANSIAPIDGAMLLFTLNKLPSPHSVEAFQIILKQVKHRLWEFSGDDLGMAIWSIATMFSSHVSTSKAQSNLDLFSAKQKEYISTQENTNLYTEFLVSAFNELLNVRKYSRTNKMAECSLKSISTIVWSVARCRNILHDNVESYSAIMSAAIDYLKHQDLAKLSQLEPVNVSNLIWSISSFALYLKQYDDSSLRNSAKVNLSIESVNWSSVLTTILQSKLDKINSFRPPHVSNVIYALGSLDFKISDKLLYSYENPTVFNNLTTVESPVEIQFAQKAFLCFLERADDYYPCDISLLLSGALQLYLKMQASQACNTFNCTDTRFTPMVHLLDQVFEKVISLGFRRIQGGENTRVYLPIDVATCMWSLSSWAGEDTIKQNKMLPFAKALVQCLLKNNSNFPAIDEFNIVALSTLAHASMPVLDEENDIWMRVANRTMELLQQTIKPQFNERESLPASMQKQMTIAIQRLALVLAEKKQLSKPLLSQIMAAILQTNHLSDNNLCLLSDLHNTTNLNLPPYFPSSLIGNNDLEIIYKPPHWITDASSDREANMKNEESAHGRLRMSDFIKSEIKSEISDKSEFQYGMAHRLDAETSGPLIVAKTLKGYLLSRLFFETHSVEKTYQCLVHGELDCNNIQDAVTIDRPILTAHIANGQTLLSKVDPLGKRAVSAYRPIAVYLNEETQKKYTFCEVQILTGRTHQIRVHMASEELPLYSDEKYTNLSAEEIAEERKRCPRHFLHCSQLKLHDPSGTSLTVQIALPSDLEEVLSQMTLIAGTPNAKQSAILIDK